MKKMSLSFAAVFFLANVLMAASANEVPRRYVSNQITVKFKSSFADSLRNQISAQDSINLFNLTSNLTELDRRYRIKKISPLIKSRVRSIAPLDIPRPSWPRIHGLETHVTRQPDLDRIYKIELDLQTGQTIEDVLLTYNNDPNVEYAEPDYYVTVDSAPNDPMNFAQWSLQKIEAPKAWDIYTGNHKTVVAVIDTGVDYNHQDLQNNMWVNELEMNGVEGIDDDNNGYIDDIYGYNFVYRDGDPLDDYGHGTHCAGIIAAEGNNNLDITGICWNARIMALKFMGSLGTGSVSDAILAHYYAVENGANVISNSWTLSEDSQALHDAIDYAYSQGVIVVAAAGNYNSSIVRYPAAFSNVISVAATNTIDNRWYYSSYGNWVDITAPGVDILSLLAEGLIMGTPYNDSLTFLSGTSTACPHVAGACALLLSANPYLTCGQVENILTRTVDSIPNGICSSNGRLNLYKAMKAAVPSQGYISFDRLYYTYDDTIHIRLADNDLKANASQEIFVITSNMNDMENIVLNQTEPNLGIFTGVIQTSSDAPIQNDGILQVASGQIVTAIYFDNYSGSDATPEPAMKTAYIDCDPPVLKQIQIDTLIRSAVVTFETYEPTKAILNYKIADNNSYNYSEEDLVTSTTHTMKLQPLALDTNYNSTINLFDRAGNQTIADNNGAGYFFSTSPEFIDFLVPDNYPTIQAAIDDATDGDTIIVSDGTYTGEGNIDIDFKGKSITLKSENGPENCIIDCAKISRAFDFHSGEDSNNIIDGFTIKNGSVGDYGGAINCSASSPTIKNCNFINNSASEYGSAIVNMYESSPQLTNCTFTNNSVGSDSSSIACGGAICNLVNSSPVLINCTFTDNYAKYCGGAIYNEDNCNPSITKCTFNSNNAQHGGAIYNYSNCNPIILNTIFSENSAQYGGAIKNSEARATIINCTLTKNYADLGGGIWNAWNGTSELLNCILWHNTDRDGTSEAAQIDGVPPLPLMSPIAQPVTTVNYCCIEGLTGTLGGTGNIADDPLFADPNKNDYHLKSVGWRYSDEGKKWTHDNVTSPCIDAGNPGSPLFDEPVNIDDDIVIQWGENIRINMGAYGGTSQASMAPPGWRLLADVNNDNIVNMKDYAILSSFCVPRSAFPITQNSARSTQYEYGDLNHDKKTTLSDISILTTQWLKTSNPK